MGIRDDAEAQRILGEMGFPPVISRRLFVGGALSTVGAAAFTLGAPLPAYATTPEEFYAFVGTEYGYQYNYPTAGVWGTHTGTDYPWGGGTPIPSPGSGTVVEKSTTTIHGHYLTVFYPVIGLYLQYCHMDGPSPLAVNATVSKGTIVGYVGQSGTEAYGYHLHLAVSNETTPGFGTRVDPVPYVNTLLNAGSPGVPIPTHQEATVSVAIAQSLRIGVGAHYLFVSPTRVSISQELSTLSPGDRAFEDNVMRAIAVAAGYPPGYNPPLIDDSSNGGWYLRNAIAWTIAGMPASFALSPSSPFERT